MHGILKLFMLVAAVQAPVGDEDMLIVRDGEAVAIEIDGARGTARIDSARSRGVVLSPQFAARLGVSRSRCRTRRRFGPVALEGVCQEASIRLGGRRFAGHVSWFGAAPAGGVDAVAGAADLPHRIVRFEFAPASPGERVVTMPLFNFERDGQGLGTRLLLDGHPVRVYFNLNRGPPLATAGAGSVIAAAQGGRLVGNPQPMLIDLGVARPVQVMRLDEPLDVGPLAFRSLLVRVTDYGRTRVPGPPSADPQEIVVTGSKRRDRRHDWLAVGRDALAGCSSLTMDKRRMVLTLSCR